MSVTNFQDNCWILNCEEEGIDLMCPKTTSISHTKLYLGIGGLELKIPCMNLMTVGCFPIGAPSTCW